MGTGRTLHLFTLQYIEGVRYLRENLDILAITLQKAAVALTVSGAFQVVQVALTERVFVIGEGGGTSLGLLYAAGGVGTGLGPILVRRFTADRERSMRIAILIAYGLSSLGLLISAPLWNFPVLLLGTLFRGVGVGINWVFTTQLLLQLLPDRVRGRVFSTEFAFLTLASAISAALGGWALDSLGLSNSDLLWWMAGLTLIPGILWLAWITTGRKRRLQAGKISEGGTGS
jgi:MFS family permease